MSKSPNSALHRSWSRGTPQSKWTAICGTTKFRFVGYKTKDRFPAKRSSSIARHVVESGSTRCYHRQTMLLRWESSFTWVDRVLQHATSPVFSDCQEYFLLQYLPPGENKEKINVRIFMVESKLFCPTFPQSPVVLSKQSLQFFSFRSGQELRKALVLTVILCRQKPLKNQPLLLAKEPKPPLPRAGWMWCNF